MAQASDYPVTFPFGATDGVYYAPSKAQSRDPSKWIRPFHIGDDRPCPQNTPIYVNGSLIGYTGKTGAASGFHLHIGKWVGGNPVNPNRGGFALPAPVKVHSLGYNASNGNFVRLQDGAGTLWIYCHLNSIKVATNQIITPPAPTNTSQGANEMITSRDDAIRVYQMLRPNGGPSEGEINDTVGRRSYSQFARDASREIEARNASLRSQSDHMGALQATVEQLNQALVNKQAQVENLSNEITAKQQEIDGQKVSLETLNMELGEAKNKLSSSIPKPAPAVPADKPVSPSPRAGLLVRLLVAYFKKRNK
jgi:hypothetical protein